MLLTLSTTREPATDLGWLLHKHPARTQAFELGFGCAHVFYPEATERRCTAALLFEVDPIELVRRRGPAGKGFSLQQYVNDRPYVANSFMSVAIAQVYGSALGGRCNDRPELVNQVLPLEARIAVLPCRGGVEFLRRLFEPLEYEVVAERHSLDPKFDDWGDSAYFTVTLRGERRLSDLLTHLYVLIPVLDNDKHYWVGDDEVEKLLRKTERPWERTGFRIKDLEAYVHEHRGELVAASLTIIRGWFTAGCPRVAVRSFGSFDEWAETIGSILHFAGIEGFLTNLDQTRSVEDDDNRQWRAVFDSWWSKFEDHPVTVAELFKAFFVEDASVPIEMPDSMAGKRERGDDSFRRSLGRQLARLEGRVFSGRKLCNTGGDTHSKVRTWALKVVEITGIEERNPANPAIPGSQATQ